MSAVLLVSGGSDSLLLARLLIEEKRTFYPLFVDYGQLAAKEEWAACTSQFKAWDYPKPNRASLPGYGNLLPSGLTSVSKRVYEDAFLPCRNLMMVVVAAAYAFQNECTSVIIGLIDQQARLFPDQSMEFVNAAESAIQTALGFAITVEAPLIDVSKKAILEMCQTHEVRTTYSCHSGTPEPCGKCVSCRERASASKIRTGRKGHGRKSK